MAVSKEECRSDLGMNRSHFPCDEAAQMGLWEVR